jgi:arylsulfatase A-like enzyme/Tfp pilus assembly protein PilF
MKNKIILIITILLIALAFIFIFMGRERKALDLNIMIITLDTTRPDHIGCYGNKNVKTPNIDWIANRGIRFENCYVPAPLTLPSHCSLFTGKYPLGHYVRNNGTYFLNQNETTLAECFKQKGYETYAVIAAYVLLSRFGLNQGFDIYDDSLDNDEMIKGFKSEITADQVYKKFRYWFEGNSGEKKFFAWIHFYDPHLPYQPPKEYVNEKETDLIKLYDGEIAFVDEYVGKIIDDLKSKDVLDETLLILVGDHGEAFGEHQEYGHMIFCYEENLKVPLIFHNKHLFKKNKVIKNRVNITSIMPTILELYKVEIPPDIQGNSFAHTFYGKEEKTERTFYVESMYGKEEKNWAPLTGIIDGSYKYISLPQSELYNLKNDPQEKNNLFRINSDITEKCDEKLRKFLLEHSEVKTETRRELSKEDIIKLRALGYISSFSDRSNVPIDPKKGVIFENKLKDLSKKIKEGDLDFVEKELEKILNETPEQKNIIVHTLLYNVHKRKGDSNAALDALKEGIKEFPESIPLRLSLALNLYDQKEYYKVIDHCNHILKKDPLFTRAYILLGDTFDHQTYPDEALKYYEKAVELEPENLSLKMKYAELLMKYKKYVQAMNIYNNLLNKYDVLNNPDLLYKIAFLNTKHGSMEMAEETMDRIIKIKPEGKYYFFYALILSKNGKLNEAIQNMETAVNKYPEQLTDEQKKAAISAIKMWKNSF